MFGRRPAQSDSFSSRYGAGKSQKPKKSFKETSFQTGLRRGDSVRSPPSKHTTSPSAGSTLTSPIVTLCVGPQQRLFAGHEDILCRSPYFEKACRGQFYDGSARRINLPDECPEVLSAVLEFLYKQDYSPRLIHNKRKDTWEIEDADKYEATIVHHAVKGPLLKDTAIYCSADRYGLSELKRLALRKQGLQSNVTVSTILASARWAYIHTPDDDSKLRGHYLALIIRSRNTFKRSSAMKTEMEEGGKLFFDLFVAMCNHIDDLQTVRSPFSR
ncbi:uncharacterized protein AB675_8612 [Cyphellophora attinorum]|uniref:BTB domain-containing protein n=1 Tax=Cyphellophora attinorum TaxID=1664694 RepID=A0A0N1HZQ9_9EURO|nr:uncharacterized protein AB675_8612 [Phialophora attinorum]KPI44387.1 hypothetical protein AB675_8612 [Phialophora attinorum]